MKVVASYSRKIQHGHYGGKDYESSDHFCSMEHEATEDQDPKEVYEELHNECMSAVAESIGNEVASFTEGVDAKTFRGWLDNYLQELPVDADTYAKMSLTQKDIIQTIKRAKKRIKK